jgi:hypothetical protein
MLRAAGKMLQLAALVLLPAAMLMQLTVGLRAPTGEDSSLSAMLLMLLLGVALFGIGRIVEGYGSSS